MKCFAAVANEPQQHIPQSVRSKNLYNIVIKGMKNTRQPQAKALEIPQDKIVETGIIDIALRDVKGNVRKLTDLKGKVVLLDFSVFQSPAGAPHNLMLRELYNTYASQGLEILPGISRRGRALLENIGRQPSVGMRTRWQRSIFYECSCI